MSALERAEGKYSSSSITFNCSCLALFEEAFKVFLLSPIKFKHQMKVIGYDKEIYIISFVNLKLLDKRKEKRNFN